MVMDMHTLLYATHFRTYTYSGFLPGYRGVSFLRNLHRRVASGDRVRARNTQADAGCSQALAKNSQALSTLVLW